MCRTVACPMGDIAYIHTRLFSLQVHRLIVVDSDNRVEGVISLSDILNYLVKEDRHLSDSFSGVSCSGELKCYFVVLLTAIVLHVNMQGCRVLTICVQGCIFALLVVVVLELCPLLM